MLQELHVKNFGIIEDIDWKLDAGLNIISGETGAGKSLIIDAIEILLNGSAGDEVIRYGCGEAHIEGVFDLPEQAHNAALRALLEEKGVPPEDNLLVISYDIKRTKNGQVRINSRTITKGLLRQIGRLLIDIHGQSQHLSLLDEESHIKFLDGFAGNAALKSEFAEQTAMLRELESELAELKTREEATLRQQEFLRYQIEEIERAALHPGEDEELENERRIISHAARLKEEALEVCRILSQSDAATYTPSVISGLHQAVQVLKKICDLDNALGQSLENLEKAFYGIEETARDIGLYSEKLDFDPGRQEAVENRLETINKLKRKYGRSVSEIMTFREDAEKELEQLGDSQARQIELKSLINRCQEQCGKLAVALSKARCKSARTLAAGVKKELVDLEMGYMDFHVAVDQTTSENGLPGEDGGRYAYSAEGIDRVQFLASTNPGEPLKPLAKIASTGEISRFTLALKGALAEADHIPVLIFDEIDIGVGGRSGETIGRKLWTLAQHHQVVCITHLAQIAAYSDAHFYVQKRTTNQKTISYLERLDGEAQLKETALMLAGPGYSQAALQNAMEILNKAAEWKSRISRPLSAA